MAFHFTIAVWGQPYIELMMKVTLPSLMSPRNLPAFLKRYPIRLFIYTTPDDAEIIRSSPVFNDWIRMVPIHLVAPEGIDVRNNPYQAMTDLQSCALEDADRYRAEGVILQNADACWGDGCLEYLADLVAEGFRHVMCTTFRVSKDRFVRDLERYKETGNRILNINCRDLVRLGLIHIHPYTASLFTQMPCFTSLPTVIGRLADDSILLHSLHTVPLLTMSDHYTVNFANTLDWDWFHNLYIAGEKLYFIESYERFAFLEMSEHFRFLNAVEPNHHFDAVSIGRWLQFFQPEIPFDGRYFLSSARFPIDNQTERNSKDIENAQKKIADDIGNILGSKYIHDIWRRLKSLGADKMSQLLACALHVAGLHEEPFLHQPFTIFVPRDDDRTGYPEDWVERLLTPGSEQRLRHMVGSYIVQGQHKTVDLPDDHADYRSITGMTIHTEKTNNGITVNGRPITLPDVSAGNCIIHLIDGMWDNTLDYWEN